MVLEKHNKPEIVTAQLSDAYPPIVDGVAQVVLQYARHLPSYLGSCYVVAPRVPDYDETGNNVLRYPSIPIPGRDPYRYGIPWASPLFMHRFTKLPIDLVHAHSPFVAGSLALQMARSRQIPMLATFHSKYLDDVRRMFPKFDLPAEVVRRHIVDFYNQADQVWVPNGKTEDILREYGYDGPIETVYLGTDLQTPSNIASLRSEAESFLALSASTPLILYVGQITYEKNLSFLIDAMKYLQGTGTDFRFIMVGEGYARPELEAKIQEIGLQNCQFTGVIRDRHLIASLFSRASVFTFPSLYDTAGLVVKEAAALGVPSLLLKGATATEGIEDGVNGFLSDHEPASYAMRLKMIMENAELRQRAGEAARQTLCHSWEEAVLEVSRRYQIIVKAHSKKVKSA